MKKLLCTSVAGLLIGSAMPAFAASTTDLAVKGTITPTACSADLTAGGTVDLGLVPLKDLNQDIVTPLPPVTVQASITCDAATLFAIETTDNRPNPSGGTARFGIGKTAADEPIGYYQMFLSNAIADEAPVRMIASLNDGASWGSLYPEDALSTTYLVAVRDPAASRPLAAQNTLIDLSVNTYIHAKKDLTISEDTSIDGSTTFTLRYL